MTKTATPISIMTREGDAVPLPGPFATIQDIKRHNQETGHHFFAPRTMDTFDSIICTGVFGGRLFITGETDPDDERIDSAADWRFTVRIALDDGSIRNATVYRGLVSREEAVHVAQLLAQA